MKRHARGRADPGGQIRAQIRDYIRGRSGRKKRGDSMAKTEAQKKAQKEFMQRGTWKKFSIVMKTQDIDHIKEVSSRSGIPAGTYIKQAISAFSGESFSWDEKEDEQ